MLSIFKKHRAPKATPTEPITTYDQVVATNHFHSTNPSLDTSLTNGSAIDSNSRNGLTSSVSCFDGITRQSADAYEELPVSSVLPKPKSRKYFVLNSFKWKSVKNGKTKNDDARCGELPQRNDVSSMVGRSQTADVLCCDRAVLDPSRTADLRASGCPAARLSSYQQPGISASDLKSDAHERYVSGTRHGLNDDAEFSFIQNSMPPDGGSPRIPQRSNSPHPVGGFYAEAATPVHDSERLAITEISVLESSPVRRHPVAFGARVRPNDGESRTSIAKERAAISIEASDDLSAAANVGDVVVRSDADSVTGATFTDPTSISGFDSTDQQSDSSACASLPDSQAHAADYFPGNRFDSLGDRFDSPRDRFSVPIRDFRSPVCRTSLPVLGDSRHPMTRASLAITDSKTHVDHSSLHTGDCRSQNDRTSHSVDYDNPLPLLQKQQQGVAAAGDKDGGSSRWTLTKELVRLSTYGWYWGPVSREEAEEKLAEQPDGAFLVRDSTDERYLFSLSFRSAGRTLHTRVEYWNSEFSFYVQPRGESYRSIAELIEGSMHDSMAGTFCYSRGNAPGARSFAVRLTKPVSRFAQVRSLQYLCRFVIRQHTRVDHIQSLPLPGSVKGWLKESQY